MTRLSLFSYHLFPVLSLFCLHTCAILSPPSTCVYYLLSLLHFGPLVCTIYLTYCKPYFLPVPISPIFLPHVAKLSSTISTTIFHHIQSLSVSVLTSLPLQLLFVSISSIAILIFLPPPPTLSSFFSSLHLWSAPLSLRLKSLYPLSSPPLSCRAISSPLVPTSLPPSFISSPFLVSTTSQPPVSPLAASFTWILNQFPSRGVKECVLRQDKWMVLSKGECVWGSV